MNIVNFRVIKRMASKSMVLGVVDNCQYFPMPTHPRLIGGGGGIRSLFSFRYCYLHSTV